MTDVLLKQGKFGLRHRHKEVDRVKTEAETPLMLPQAKEYPGPPGTKRGKERSFPQPSEGAWSYQHLDGGLLASRIVRE